MVRKLSLAVAVALGVVPFGSQALGLGDIRTKSALNQRLNADIQLYSVGEGEIADINVRLASPDVFLEAGIDRPHFLSGLKFEPVLMPDGSSVIRVTSPDPVREPFLDFLIKVDWPNGQMLREYTVLLDPPATTAQRPAPVQRPAAGTPAIQRETGAQSAPAMATMSMAGGDGGSYGPTRRSETLWGIAKKVRHDGTSIEQMVMSLLYANPQAFTGSNVNNLKVGQILRVPSREEVMALKYSDAHTAFRAQMNDWRASRGSGAASAGGAQAAGQQMSGSTPMTGARPMQPEAELKIASAASEDEKEAARSESGEPEKVSAQLQQDLILANEATESALEEGQELKSRVEDLESQLEDLQRLLILKSEQLAEMQGMLGFEAPTVQPETPGPEMEQAEPAAQPETPAEPEAAVEEEIGTVEEPVAEERGIEPEEQAASQETAPTAVIEDVSPVTEPVTQPEPEPRPVVEAKPEPKPAEKSIIEKLSGDTTLMAIAAGAVAVVLGLLWLVIGRRRRGRDEFQESILINTIDEKDYAEQRMETPQESKSQSQEETSFLSDFSPSDIDPLQGESGEVDSLAEADVYVAYGRYRQAEELIRQAMEREPERLELKAKLFEILYAIKDKDGFAELAERSVEEGLPDADAAIWSRVVSMGAKMAPSSALFAAGGAALDIQQGPEAPGDGLSDIDDLDLEALDTGTDIAASQQPQPEAADFSLDGLEVESGAGAGSVTSEGDFTLDLGGETERETVLQGADETEQVFSLDLDTEVSEKTEEVVSISQEADLDFGTADQELTGVSVDASEPEISEADLSMLDSLEQDGKNLDQDVIDLDEGLSDLNLDDLELEMTATNPDKGEAADPQSGIAALELPEDVGEFDLDSIDQSLLDEVDTKLDLARAYVDMEDKDGARSILDEVLKEGNEEQKASAEKMMVGLN